MLSHKRRRSKRNPGFNQSWWSLYRAAIAGLCGDGASYDCPEGIAELAAEIADAAWALWTARNAKGEGGPAAPGRVN